MTPQQATVISFLRERGNRGATNREGMFSCNINDFRKRVSEINDMEGYLIESIVDPLAQNGNQYHRYYLRREPNG